MTAENKPTTSPAPTGGTPERHRELNRLLQEFARACRFGDDHIARMATSKAIHDFFDAALSPATGGTERESIIRAAVAAMPHTNSGVANDLLQGFNMHIEADDIVAIWKAAALSGAPMGGGESELRKVLTELLDHELTVADKEIARRARALLSAAPAQPQEPVATVKENPYCPEGKSDELDTYLPVGMKLYAAPQVAPASEAVRRLSRAEIDAIVYACRQSGDDTTYAIVNAALATVSPAAPPNSGEVDAAWIERAMQLAAEACSGAEDVGYGKDGGEMQKRGLAAQNEALARLRSHLAAAAPAAPSGDAK